MRKQIFLHQWLLLTCCAFALLSSGMSPPFVAGTRIGIGLEENPNPPGLESTDSAAVLKGTTDPFNNNDQDSVTDSTDLTLNFENGTPGDASYETTTNVPGVAKTGRHFGGRLGPNNRNNVVFPSLRVRPTTPGIPLNRVIKRRKNPSVNSTFLKGWNGSVEIASGLTAEITTTTTKVPTSPVVRIVQSVGTSTSHTQNSLLNRRKTLAELINSRPTPTPSTISIRRSSSYSSSGKITLETQTESDVDPIVTEPESSNLTPVEASAVSFSPYPSSRPVVPFPSRNLISGIDFPLNAEPVSRHPISPAPSNLFVPLPLPQPSFDINPTVTSTSGIYHFRFTTTLPTSSRVVHAEEFGITRESYGEDEDEEPQVTGPDNQQEEPPTTWRSTSYYSPPERTTIAGSEEEFSVPTLQPAYRDYFHQGNKGPGLSVRFEEAVAIANVESHASSSVTLNEMPPLSEPNLENENETSQSHSTSMSTIGIGIGIDETNRPTPSLPLSVKNPTPSVVLLKVDQSTQDSLDPYLPINSTSSNIISLEEPQEQDQQRQDYHHNHQQNHQQHQDFNGSGNGIFVISSSRVSINSSLAVADKKGEILDTSPTHVISISPTPTISSREFKSTYFTSAEHPLYTVSSYSYSSSTEYSFFVPDLNGNHHHDVESDQDHDHENETDEQNLDDPKQKEQQELRPSTSTLSYWDTLGLKSLDSGIHLASKTINDSHFNYPSPSPSPSSAGDLESSFSTPHAKTSFLPPLTSPRPPTVVPYPTSSEENEINSNFESLDSTEAGDSSSKENVNVNPNILVQLPQVPFVIQIWLDMQATTFCKNVPIFKIMIVKVYQEYSNVSSDQVVIFSEPSCSNIFNSNSTGRLPHPLPLIETRNSSSLSPGSSTSQQILKNNIKKSNKTKRADQSGNENGMNLTSTSTSSLYSVYVYLTDKNGAYDLWLTGSFIDFWNNSSRPDENSTFFNKIKKVEMISSSQSISGHAPTNENAGIIAAIAIASIAAVSLFLVGILLLVMRHRQAKTKFAKRCTPVTLDDYSLDNISVFNSFRRKQRNRASKRSYTNAAFEDHNAPSKPLNAAALLILNTDISSLMEEFSLIPNVNPTLDDIPSGAETKNRFANVIPMPDSRVLLTFQDEQPNSDYINANFARGTSNMSKVYILTQGPLDETIVDFWRMIWEQQVRVIIMLTDFAEAGIPKCAEYYPRSETLDCSQLHGDYQVTLEKRDVSENCITSNLVIKDMERSLRRDVVHLWYHSWPEKGVPAHPKNTADFLVKSRKYTKEPCPIVVHCSPGTGRSGTLVVCDIGMKELESLHTVDIPQIVKKLRQDRAGAVQTKEQYKHIYEVIQYYATKLSSTQLDSV